MKAILLSIKPKWCALMMNGDKTIEVRTSKALAKAIQKLIDKNGYAEIYVYCTKEEYLTCDLYTGKARYHNIPKGKSNFTLSGKVVFKFRCYKVEEIEKCWYQESMFGGYYEELGTKSYEHKMLLDYSCLTRDELYDYVDYLTKKSVYGYAIHISNLEIFDRPKDLGEFKVSKKVHKCDTCIFNPLCVGICVKETYSTIKTPLTKAPQSFMFIEVEE